MFELDAEAVAGIVASLPAETEAETDAGPAAANAVTLLRDFAYAELEAATGGFGAGSIISEGRGAFGEVRPGAAMLFECGLVLISLAPPHAHAPVRTRRR